jgi:hypothetical protein
MIINRAITATALIGGLIALATSLIYGNVIIVLASALLFTISLALWKYGYILIPLFTRAANVIEVRGEHEVPSSRDYIIKKTASGYFVTRFLEIRFYESSMDKSEDQKTTMFESFEKAISSLRYVVKISLLVSVLDLSKEIEDIKTRRSAAETKKAKAGSGSDEITKLDREIAKWNRLLDRLMHGEKSIELIAFASTSAFGLTRDEAVSRASRQAKELKTILSSSMGAEVHDLVDRDMLQCFEWDYFVPSSSEEVKDDIF